FLDWVVQTENFVSQDKALIANSFLPRQVYGHYLCTIWEAAKNKAHKKQIKLTVIDSFVTDLKVSNTAVTLLLNNGSEVTTDYCVIASGNQVPRNPRIKNPEFYQSKNYYQNPWKIESVLNTKNDKAVLIIGNGLTMVDTVLALLEHGFKGDIFSVSPNGFNILPHRHNGLKYTKLVEELTGNLSLHELFKLVHKHIKSVREFGVSAEPVIDSLRPYTQQIWRSFTDAERKLFMSRFRHLWGVARHRIPLHSHDKIQQLRIDGKLHLYSGKIIDLTETSEGIRLDFFNKKEKEVQSVYVSRVINCTGPETDVRNMENCFLKNCLINGVITQDNLKLGIKTDTRTFQVIDAAGEKHPNLFTIGANLKGELWESTAVNELRVQAQNLAEQIVAPLPEPTPAGAEL
ncbi:MAG: hypothetical protein EOP51_18060, partial [Sphingobacteriales bacterium]